MLILGTLVRMLVIPVLLLKGAGQIQCPIPQLVKQAKIQSILFARGAYIFLYPGIRLASHVNESIAGAYNRKILHGGLIAVHIASALQKKGELYVLTALRYISQPIVLGENGADYMKLITVIFSLHSASRKDGAKNGKKQKYYYKLFHCSSLFFSFLSAAVNAHSVKHSLFFVNTEGA